MSYRSLTKWTPICENAVFPMHFSGLFFSVAWVNTANQLQRGRRGVPQCLIQLTERSSGVQVSHCAAKKTFNLTGAHYRDEMTGRFARSLQISVQRTVVPSASSRRDRIWRCGLTPLLFYSRPLTGTSNSFSAPRILSALSSHSNNTYTSADNTSDTCNYRRRPIIFCKQQRYCSSSADSDRKFNYRPRLIVG